MQNFNNDDVKKMLEMLKEQAENTHTNAEEKTEAQTTDNSVHSDEDIKNMLKKHFSAEENDTFAMSEDYSFDTVDFGRVDDEIITGEIKVEKPEAEVPETAQDKSIDEKIIEDEPACEEIVDDKPTEDEPVKEEIVEDKASEGEPVKEEIVETVLVDEEIVEDESVNDEIIDDEVAEDEPAYEEIVEDELLVEKTVENEFVEENHKIEENTEETVEEIFEDVNEAPESIEETSENIEEISEIVKDAETEEILQEISEEISEEVSEEIADDTPENEPISEESINYDEVLEGQQGTVFNNFVEDFTGDLDDVVFEAEITESRAPDKQYTIFEDWEKLMKDKNYATAEDGIIPPTDDELAYSAEISKRASGNTDYFNPVTSADLDAVDIALMVALGGESELNQTVGFEKIRQAVHDEEEKDVKNLTNKKIYGYCGEEYTNLSQNEKIKKKYKRDKTAVILQTIGTAILALVLLAYEITGWIGYELPSVFSVYEYPRIYVLAGLQLLFLCAVISFNKISNVLKNLFDFSSISYIASIVLLVICVIHDILILAVGYAEPGITIHSLSAFLMLISLIYDLFEVVQQKGVFNIVATGDKKLILEPYGKLRMDDSEDRTRSEIIDKDSYCISRVSSVNNYYARIAKSAPNGTSKLIALIISFSVALCVMLVLLLMGETFATIVLGFIITLSFALICASIFESEFAYFIVYLVLRKYKTGIIGKSSIAEYGKCNIVYFDDYNVFNKKSVRTKGLKLYDNNEIYRVLYHTQAVFSKIGGPLKGVFEFATTEMVHSKNVDIKDISKDGIVAVVDGKTTVHIGTGSFMKSRGIHPSYTSADLKVEERGDESIMFIALGGKLGAKLYVTYQFSAEFEKLARKLTARGVGIGIRSCDPNVNNKWAKKYGNIKKMNISIVRPTLKDFKPHEKSIEGGLVSIKNVRALSEALMMCIKLDKFESLIAKMRTISVIVVGILSFALVLFSGINVVSMLVLSLACALSASIMILLTHFYIKH